MDQGELYNKLNRSTDHKACAVDLTFKVLVPKDWSQKQAENFLVSYIWGLHPMNEKYAAEVFGKKGDEAIAVLA